MPDNDRTPDGQKNRYEGMADGILSILNGGDPPGLATKRDYSADDRAEMAKNGQAMSDGSFPIKDREDLENAISAIGRARDPKAARQHVIKEREDGPDINEFEAMALACKRARQLGLSDLIPESWSKDKDLALPSQEERRLYCGIDVKDADAAPPADTAGDAANPDRWLDWTNFAHHWAEGADEDALRAAVSKDMRYTYVERTLMQGRLLQSGYDRQQKELAALKARLETGSDGGDGEMRRKAMKDFEDSLGALKASGDAGDRTKHAQAAHDHLIAAVPGVTCSDANDGDADDAGQMNKTRTKEHTLPTRDATLDDPQAEVERLKAAVQQMRSELDERVKDAELALEQAREEHADEMAGVRSELKAAKERSETVEGEFRTKSQQLDEAMRRRLPDPQTRVSVESGQRPRAVKAVATTRDYLNQE